MRALRTLVKVVLGAVLLLTLVFGVVAPLTWLSTVANLPNQLESAADVELQLRKSIESERLSVEPALLPTQRGKVKWEKPSLEALPKSLVALYVTSTGCPGYFQSPAEEGWPWTKRLLASLGARMMEGDGACELIFARNLAERLGMKTDLQMAVGADRVHRFLTKEQLVAFDLQSMPFDRGVIGVGKASEVLMHKPLASLTLAEAAELQLAIPPWSYWEDIKTCHNASMLKEARDKLLTNLENISPDELREPVRCTSIKR